MRLLCQEYARDFDECKAWYDGLRETVIALMAGEHRHITTANFMNDMTTFQSADDVLTLLVHLGYLGYDFEEKAVFVPNREILLEYASATGDDNWGEAHGLA